jgi:bacterioferritin-associated ferredoxin
MFICLCNSLRDKEVNGAIQEGACSVSSVFRAFGCQPQCGKCVPMIRDTLQDNQTIGATA